MYLTVMAEVFVAGLAVMGLYYGMMLLWDGVLRSRNVAVCVEILTEEDAQNLDLLLREADRSRLFCRKKRMLVLLSPAFRADEDIWALVEELGAEGYVIEYPKT